MSTQPNNDIDVSYADDVVDQIAAGKRFAGLFATAPASPNGSGVTLSVVLAGDTGFDLLDTTIGQKVESITPRVAAAFWYERVIHDLFGITPTGHPRLDPLVLPQEDDEDRRYPRPGSAASIDTITPSEQAVPRRITGTEMFTMPHGPVRSGVTESIEYLVETPGEEIPHLQVRVFAKHRGVERAFQGRTLLGGALVAERVEGIAGVAHTLAYCQAIESLSDVEIPPAAQLIRALHAELERMANHLEVVAKLCDAAGLVLAQSRFTLHKETVQRIRHRLCGNRYSRAVVIPGGVNTPREVPWPWLDNALTSLWDDLRRDRNTLMVTSSFLDRVRTTGPLSSDVATEYGALGPVGRGSGIHNDVRKQRPYGAYPTLAMPNTRAAPTCDALARLQVRWIEIDESLLLGLQISERLFSLRADSPLVVPLGPVSGRGIGATEGPQGETLYVVEVNNGHLVRVWPRSPSFHNLVLFHQVFHGDVLTDFAFIEASFGISNAGVVV